jgi:negative regulator of replication initiation
MAKSISVDDETYKLIAEFAKEDDRPISNALSRLVKLGLGISRPPENKKVEIPNGVGSQANKQEPAVEHIGRREVKSVPQLIEEINLIKARYAEEAEFCQDQEQLNNLNKNMNAEIQPLQAQIDSMV